ncbi:MAG TPA: ABC transporter ATP-binding protein [Candidatus Hydrogenedentes bacterium]|nr:ABC transporter ATP-binding protein [Candidatus Hydrogenedentota bacterium]
MSTPVIEVHHLVKEFPARRGARDLRGRGGLGDWLRGQKTGRFRALDDVSFTVSPGESLGIIGRNGSGKSTLLSLIAGVTRPTSGRVIVRGRVASLLELGAGFHPILTGRENVYLNAGLLGMRHRETDAVLDEILRFADIGDFIDQPVETYSSGMFVRLGFAVAAHTNPDIFLVDEVLAVGDEAFQRKCRWKIGELREQGKTIVFVSHDLGLVHALCDRVVLLDGGRLVQRDTPQETITWYLRQVGNESGVHVFRAGRTEAVQCEGRISLFRDGREITAPAGLGCSVVSLGQYHAGSQADWKVQDRHETGCVVRGRFPRLPVSLWWTEQIDETGRFHWRVELECERACALDQVNLALSVPAAYTRWMYGDFSGTFPEIQPSDTRWTLVLSPEMRSNRAAALPDDSASLPPLLFEAVPLWPHVGLAWYNAEYLAQSRVLQASVNFMALAEQLEAGRHPLVELVIDPTLRAEDASWQIRSDRTVRSGRMRARFEHGGVRLFFDDEELTAYLNGYAAMLIEHLWADSHTLQWQEIRSEGEGFAIEGISRRFPFRQLWRLWPEQDGIRFEIDLETDTALQAEEYQVSLVLRPEYDSWRTDAESGRFAPFQPEDTMWKHQNRTYPSGNMLAAWGGGLPQVAFMLQDNSPPMRPTAINTSALEKARVLQFLRTGDGGRLVFGPGRHCLFSGLIRVEATGDLPVGSFSGESDER